LGGKKDIDQGKGMGLSGGEILLGSIELRIDSIILEISKIFREA
jgi:hypothetical protein